MSEPTSLIAKSGIELLTFGTLFRLINLMLHTCSLMLYDYSVSRYNFGLLKNSKAARLHIIN